MKINGVFVYKDLIYAYIYYCDVGVIENKMTQDTVTIDYLLQIIKGKCGSF